MPGYNIKWRNTAAARESTEAISERVRGERDKGSDKGR
jgi:hypothetical protein